MSQVKLTADSGGGTTSLKAPSSTTSDADVVLKLPVADGSANQVLKTDGSGQLSFTSNAGTTINNNADNRVITGSGTANTLEGESNLTFNGTKLSLTPPANTGNDGLEIIPAGGSTASSFKVKGNQSAGVAAGRNGGVVEIDANYYAPTSDIFTIKSRGSTVLNMYGNGNVGIGTSSPAKNLHVANSGVATVRIETTDSRGQAWDLLSTNGSQNNTGSLSFRDESGSAYLEFGANGGSPELTVRNGGANDLLVVDNNGNVNKPRNAFAIIHTNSGDAGVSNNKIKDAYAVFTGVHLNQGSHYNTSNGRFTCPVAGVYGIAFASNLNMSTMSTGNNFNIQTRKNGSIQLYNYDTVFTTGWQYMSFTNYVNCNANDYLQIYYGGSQPFGADQGSGVWGELYFWLVQ